MSNLELIARLFLSVLFGGVIGIERESVKRPAGFRTHILVCIGSTLTMMVSIYMFDLFYEKVNIDPARIAAQVISGIGFLGAGTIIRDGASVRGLTTAASLWTIAAIGLAVGSGFYLAAALTTFFTFIILLTFSKLENHIPKKSHLKDVFLVIKDSPGQIGKIGTVLGELNINIKGIKVDSNEDDKLALSLSLSLPPKIRINDITERLLKLDGIYDIEYENLDDEKTVFFKQMYERKM